MLAVPPASGASGVGSTFETRPTPANNDPAPRLTTDPSLRTPQATNYLGQVGKVLKGAVESVLEFEKGLSETLKKGDQGVTGALLQSL